MNPQQDASRVKVKNVIDMAFTFTAMTRVFAKESKQRITQRLETNLGRLDKVRTKEDFERIHSEFCSWFVTDIQTAKREKNGKVIKSSGPASYGHGAKVFDIVVKVYVYYCHLPSCKAAETLLPFLHGAVDTPIMENLKCKYPSSGIKASTIEEIKNDDYVLLQELVSKHIKEEFKNQIHPAQYDDIMWHRLNR